MKKLKTIYCFILLSLLMLTVFPLLGIAKLLLIAYKASTPKSCDDVYAWFTRMVDIVSDFYDDYLSF